MYYSRLRRLAPPLFEIRQLIDSSGSGSGWRLIQRQKKNQEAFAVLIDVPVSFRATVLLIVTGSWRGICRTKMMSGNYETI
jgi:hypothetical protein